MAGNLIPLGTDARKYSEIISAVNQLRLAFNQITYVRNLMTEMRTGESPNYDYSQVEAYFGAPAGKGTALFALVNATYTAMNVAGLQNLIDRVI